MVSLLSKTKHAHSEVSMSVHTLSQSPIASQPETPESEANSRLHLDLFSTTQTLELKSCKISPELIADIEFEIEQSEALQTEQCERGAPFICYPDGQGRWRLVQGCCNNWLCPRCGHIRARQEYARILQGVQVLIEQGHTLYFHTLTCRGRELSLEESEADYYKWTNRLLSACRIHAKRHGIFWCYVQVTERQQRQHPHSHLITTFLPADAVLTRETRTRPDGTEYSVDVYVSKLFTDWNKRAGLGSHHKIEAVYSPIGMAVYLSKYLFKDCMTTPWPPRWKRIRYGNNWPKLADVSSPEAFPVLTLNDWNRVKAIPGLVYADSNITYERALARLVTNVVFVG
jgi:hypothetical protein